MICRRTGRIRKARTIWEEKGALPATKDPKITKEAARTVEKTALKPVATGPLPKETGLDGNQLPELPDYNPPLDLEFQPAKSLAMDLPEFQIFQRILTMAIIDRIVIATNSYADRVRKKALELPGRIFCLRPWKPVNSTDILRYIGCLLYMGAHIEKRHEDHWS